jgi:hypothetical protein
MQGETSAASGYVNTAVSQPADDDIVVTVIDAFEKLAKATSVDRGIVASLTEANSRLTKRPEDSSQTLKKTRALLKKERNDHSYRNTFAPYNDN